MQTVYDEEVREIERELIKMTRFSGCAISMKIIHFSLRYHMILQMSQRDCVRERNPRQKGIL